MTHLSRLTSIFEIPEQKNVFSSRAQRTERFFGSQTHFSYLVATNAKDLGCVMSYLVATNAKVLEPKDKDKCLISRNNCVKANVRRETESAELNAASSYRASQR